MRPTPVFFTRNLEAQTTRLQELRCEVSSQLLAAQEVKNPFQDVPVSFAALPRAQTRKTTGLSKQVLSLGRPGVPNLWHSRASQKYPKAK